MINSTFIANAAYSGGAFYISPGSSLTVIGCYARANAASGFNGGTVQVEGLGLKVIVDVSRDTHANDS